MSDEIQSTASIGSDIIDVWKKDMPHPHLKCVARVIRDAYMQWEACKFDDTGLPYHWPGDFHYAEKIIEILTEDE